MPTREARLWSSMTETSWRFYLWVSMLATVVLWGLYAYVEQLRHGLVVTGMRDHISWGLYISNFVFFIGISHAGTLLSAILRLTGAEWRRPLTRMAEAITVAALVIGAAMPLVDMGRPDRMLNLLWYGRLQSPILWDILSLVTYLSGCTLYLWLLMIPDIALLRDTYPNPARWRKRLYALLALGYRGESVQNRWLDRATLVVTVTIVPLAVSVHTVVSWIFGMTLRPGWDSSIFGPYFVVGALYSGAASVIVAMYVFRRVYRLEEYITAVHFRNLGILLLSFTLLYLYFNLNEYLTMGYKFAESERRLLNQLFFEDYSAYFWGVQTVGVLIPMLLLMAVLGLPHCRRFAIPGVALASLLVVTGAWAKRYLIIIPTLGSPYLPIQGVPWEWSHYRPTWVEWAITAAAFAGFLLIYTILSKLFPIISIWETLAGEVAKVEPQRVTEPVPSVWGRIPPFAVILLALLLGKVGPVQAREPVKPRTTVLAVQWQKLTPAEAARVSAEKPLAEDSPRAYLFINRVFNWPNRGASATKGGTAASVLAVTATLRDAHGAPLSFQAVEFSLHTSLGLLRYGSRPTDEEGEARLVIRDHRYGKYPLEVAFAGDDIYASSRWEVTVDFGTRPPPSLPREGVLITPYATAAIGIPFLIFYGAIWVVFLYAFGYLVLWRMRRSGAGETRPENGRA